jgi:hypothetical protein
VSFQLFVKKEIVKKGEGTYGAVVGKNETYMIT